MRAGFNKWQRKGRGTKQIQPYYHYGIFVNMLGKRFMDEYGPYTKSNSIACSILKQPGMRAAYVWDARIAEVMGEKINRYVPPGIIIKAQSLEELATAAGINTQGFLETVREFNGAVQAGKALSLDVPKSDYAYQIENPPFYAICPVYAGFNCTYGGPQITPRSEIIDTEGKTIPGLYACGEMIGGFFWGNYYTTPGGAVSYRGTYQVITSSLSVCIVFARLAGQEASLRAQAGGRGDD